MGYVSGPSSLHCIDAVVLKCLRTAVIHIKILAKAVACIMMWKLANKICAGLFHMGY